MYRCVAFCLYIRGFRYRKKKRQVSDVEWDVVVFYEVLSKRNSTFTIQYVSLNHQRCGWVGFKVWQHLPIDEAYRAIHLGSRKKKNMGHMFCFYNVTHAKRERLCHRCDDCCSVLLLYKWGMDWLISNRRHKKRHFFNDGWSTLFVSQARKIEWTSKGGWLISNKKSKKSEHERYGVDRSIKPASHYANSS